MATWNSDPSKSERDRLLRLARVAADEAARQAWRAAWERFLRGVGIDIHASEEGERR